MADRGFGWWKINTDSWGDGTRAPAEDEGDDDDDEAEGTPAACQAAKSEGEVWQLQAHWPATSKSSISSINSTHSARTTATNYYFLRIYAHVCDFKLYSTDSVRPCQTWVGPPVRSEPRPFANLRSSVSHQHCLRLCSKMEDRSKVLWVHE